nr:MAG TPA: hypothetical protein [Caudoviricetes sp.]
MQATGFAGGLDYDLKSIASSPKHSCIIIRVYRGNSRSPAHQEKTVRWGIRKRSESARTDKPAAAQI